MGAVKQHFHDQICEAADFADEGPEPTDAELLAVDVENSVDRLLAEAARHPGDVNPLWNSLALVSDKLSHFLETAKTKRA